MSHTRMDGTGGVGGWMCSARRLEIRRCDCTHVVLPAYFVHTTPLSMAKKNNFEASLGQDCPGPRSNPAPLTRRDLASRCWHPSGHNVCAVTLRHEAARLFCFWVASRPQSKNLAATLGRDGLPSAIFRPRVVRSRHLQLPPLRGNEARNWHFSCNPPRISRPARDFD